MAHHGEDVAIVIRSAGERTEKACLSLIEPQFPSGSVAVINGRPFERALACSYRRGIDTGARWLITVDADLLLRPDALRDLLSFGETMPNDVFQVQPLVLDKFFGGYRRAGLRLYRASHLEKAIGLVPADGEKIRPESWVVGEMGRMGYRTVMSGSVAGLHDYEQYYRDIYRKSYVHALKHDRWLPRVLLDWRRRADEDLDYWVALHGLWAGLMSDGRVRLDVAFFPDSVEDILVPVQAEEKPALHDGEIAPSYVEARISEAGPPPLRRSHGERFRELRDRLGWPRVAIWGLGWGLTCFGRTIQAISDR